MIVIRSSVLFFLIIACLISSAYGETNNPFAQNAPDSPAAASSDTTKTDSLPPIETMPELTRFVKAEYPPDLVKKGIEGIVTLDIIVNDSGTVDSVSIVKGLNPLLDSSACKAARAFIFKPAIAAGKPVPVLMEYEYRFTIDEVVTKVEQFVNLQGKLFERGTRTPITSATIAVFFVDTAADSTVKVPFTAYLKKIGSFDGQSLQGNTLITTADSIGSFAFKSLPAGLINIKVVAPDYETFIDHETIAIGSATDVIYRLQRIAYGDNEIVVYGKAEKKEVAQRTLTLNEVRKIPGLGGDAVKVVQALPGVARSAFNLGSIIVRGSGEGSSRFFLDGIQIPLLFHFGGLTSTYNSNALESVDFYPGGFGTRYGGALGGIIEIKGRRSKTDRFHGYLDANLFDASFLVEGPLSKKVSFLAAGRRSYIADVFSAAINALGISLPFTVVPYYWDYLVRADVDITKNNHCFLSLFGAKDAMDLITNAARGGSVAVDAETNRAKMDLSFHMGIFGWDWDILRNLKNSLRYSFELDNQGMAVFGFMKMQGTGYMNYLRDQLSYTVRDGLLYNAGIDAEMAPYDLKLTLPGGGGNIIYDTSHYFFGPIAAYTNVEWKPTPRLLLIPGLRFDYYPELKYDGSIVPEFWHYQEFNNNRGISGEPSVRLTAKYELVPRHKIKGSLGTYNQTPQPIGQSIDTAWGYPYLPAEKGSQYVAGYEWQISDLVSADVQTYYNHQWDNARMASTADLATGSTQKFYSYGKSRMYGMEILLKHEQGKRFFGWVSYSLSRSERWDNTNRRWNLFSSDQTHYLQLIGNYRITPSQDIGTRLRFVSGDPTTPILGVDYYDATAGRYVPKYGKHNSDRMQPYLSFDLRYEKKFTYAQWLWSAYLDVTHVENLFNKGYRSPEFSGYEWNYDYSDKTVFADITRPAIGLKVEF